MRQEIVLFPPTAEMPTPANLRCGPSADDPTVSAQPEHVAVREMPSLFRLVSLMYSQVAPRRFRCDAMLFADGQDVRVAWECAQPDTRLNPGVLVSVRWLPRTHSIAGEICIGRLVLLEIPELGADLFKTVPQTWVVAMPNISYLSVATKLHFRVHRAREGKPNVLWIRGEDSPIDPLNGLPVEEDYRS